MGQFVATVGTDEIEISAERHDDGRWRVALGDRVHVVDAREIRPGVWSLLCEGDSHVIDLDRRKRGTSIIVGTHEVMTQIEDARRKRLTQAVSSRAPRSGEVIETPIAGKVVEIGISVGDTVEAGQSVGVLEAMKMENEIKAERGGTVEAVHVEAGQSVDTGDKLITLV